MQLLPVSAAAPSPFRLSLPPQAAFAHRSWQHAEQTALAAIARGDRVLLLGQPGTGKTFLLQCLESTLRSRGQAARQFRPSDKLQDVARDDALLIDEAGAYCPEQLDQICALPNAFVIAGLPSLQALLASRPGTIRSVTLDPLAPEEVARFMVARLTAAGRARDLFTPEAVLRLARHSGGLLRLVVILAGASLFFAEQRGAAQVSVGDVDEAAVMRAAVAEAAEPETLPAAAAPAEPAWVSPAAPRKRRLWPTFRLAAGVAGFGLASLAVVALAIAAALAIGSGPSIPLQAAQSRSAPALANAALPVLLAASPPVPAPAAAFIASAPPVPPQAAQSRSAPALASAVQPVLLVSPAPTQLAAAPPAPTPARAAAPWPRLAPPPAPVPPDAAARPATVLAFSGPIMNDTMGQGGRLSLQLRTDGSGRPVGAWFHASHGLIGTGPLSGEIGPDGRVVLSGRLMMGRNPFDCDLQATLEGDRLVGEATFVRATSGAKAHSRFTLSRL